MNPLLARDSVAAAGESAGHLIARLARQVELAVAGFGLTFAQYRMLAILGDDGRAAASKLAEMMAVSRPTVTGVVDGLVARGLVCRETVDGDRRRVDVVLTETGRSVVETADLEVQRRLSDARLWLSLTAEPTAVGHRAGRVRATMPEEVAA